MQSILKRSRSAGLKELKKKTIERIMKPNCNQVASGCNSILNYKVHSSTCNLAMMCNVSLSNTTETPVSLLFSIAPFQKSNCFVADREVASVCLILPNLVQLQYIYWRKRIPNLKKEIFCFLRFSFHLVRRWICALSIHPERLKQSQISI